MAEPKKIIKNIPTEAELIENQKKIMDQPPPTPGRNTVAPEALKSLTKVFAEQIEKGKSKYGTSLMTFNGRDAGEDAMQELVDLLQYLTQLRMEKAALEEEVSLLHDMASNINPISPPLKNTKLEYIRLALYHSRIPF